MSLKNKSLFDRAFFGFTSRFLFVVLMSFVSLVAVFGYAKANNIDISAFVLGAFK
jgi:hypothetical protein